MSQTDILTGKKVNEPLSHTSVPSLTLDFFWVVKCRPIFFVALYPFALAETRRGDFEFVYAVEFPIWAPINRSPNLFLSP